MYDPSRNSQPEKTTPPVRYQNPNTVDARRGRPSVNASRSPHAFSTPSYPSVPNNFYPPNGFSQSPEPAFAQEQNSFHQQPQGRFQQSPYFPSNVSSSNFAYPPSPPTNNYYNQGNSMSPPQTGPTIPRPPIPGMPTGVSPPMNSQDPAPSVPSAFYEVPSTNFYDQQGHAYSSPIPQQPPRPQHNNQGFVGSQRPQQPSYPEVAQAPYQSQPMGGSAPQPVQPLGSLAAPFMAAGLQQMSNMAQANGFANAALGAQILQSFAPSAAGYTTQMFDQSQEKVKSFLRLPKYYFAVNHRYVLRKMSLILFPFLSRTWGRQRGLDHSFDGVAADNSSVYLPPREDVNAPDLYIPVMSFLTYVLVVAIVFGMRNAFQADVLAKYFSKGLGVLTMEVLIIKLGLYLINARPTPWLDVIAYRGYKFIGVVLTIVLGLAYRRLYYPALFYSATAMGIFLMRSHRRIILPRDMDVREGQDLARRNAFLLFVWLLQYPIYWILARVLTVTT